MNEPTPPRLVLLDPVRQIHELVVAGRVYADQAPQLRAALEAQQVKKLVVDASTLEQIDSSGLGAFVDLLKRIRPAGGRIAFYGLSPDIRRVFEITKLSTVMEVHDTRQAALESLAA